MIFLNITIDNLYLFKETFFDFTYPRKILDSTINYEYLEEFPNINFKRVNIIMGANASGKTSFGKIMRNFINYLNGKEIENFSKIIENKKENATIEAIYILPENKTINKINISFNEENIISESFSTLQLQKSWSLKKSLENIHNTKATFEYDINNLNYGITKPSLKSIAVSKGVDLISPNTHWYFQFSDGGDYSQYFRFQDIDILKRVLQAFDSSITKVVQIDSETYLITFENGDKVIIEEGKILNKERLSRGTQEAIELSSFLNAVIKSNKQKISGTFYLDEKMAYSHSEIEIAMINVIIEKLNRYSQFFYTTHNYDILDMSLPSHSFLFLKRENNHTKVVHPEKLQYTKNDRSLLNYVKNDVFGTLPNTYLIDELL